MGTVSLKASPCPRSLRFNPISSRIFVALALIFTYKSSLVAQMVKRLPAMRETWVDPWVGKISWRRKRQPTPVLLPGKSHGRRSLVGYSPWGRKESDTTYNVHLELSFVYGIRKRFNFILLHVVIQLSQHYFLKRLFTIELCYVLF